MAFFCANSSLIDGFGDLYIPVSVLIFGNTIGGCISVLDFG